MSAKVKTVILIAVIAILLVGFLVNKFKQKSENHTVVEILETKNIGDIWKIEDKNEFIVNMDLYIAEKCDYGNAMHNLNDAQRVFYITQKLEAEVNNGGFSQFFYNTDGMFVNELVSSFEKIDSVKTTEICKKAVSIFGSEIPTDIEQIQDILNTDDEVTEEKNSILLEECDIAFYKYEEDLLELNYQFIIKNKESFLN